MDNGSVTFFDINAFGFYRLKKQAKDLEFKFGTISDVFDDLNQWLNGKKIEETLPWDDDVHAMRSKTYCRGVAVDPTTKDIVMVMLRAVGDGSGNLHGVKVGSVVGAGESETIKAGTQVAGEEVIWGEPCYYWIIPEHNKMASIIFKHSGADTVRFRNYVNSHVNNNSNLGTIKNQTSSQFFHPQQGRNVVRTSTLFEFGEGKNKCNCIFKFDVEQTKIRTAINNLESIRDNITKTIIRDTTTARVADERGPLLRLASDYLPSLFGGAPELRAPKRVEVIIDGAPSKEDIERLFADRTDETDWVDVGFKIEGSDIPVWLTKYIVKSTLAIDSDGLSHYSPEKILAEINKVRNDLLTPVLNEVQAEAEAEADRNDDNNAAQAVGA